MLRRCFSAVSKGPKAVRRPANEARRVTEKAERDALTTAPEPQAPAPYQEQLYQHFEQPQTMGQVLKTSCGALACPLALSSSVGSSVRSWKKLQSHRCVNGTGRSSLLQAMRNNLKARRQHLLSCYTKIAFEQLINEYTFD
ncbi:hypothetical protein Ae201684P_003769 [Aphanomyces euteiches]|nr:hypothetical protein Ae201684P_003769 [Aphanomyces euteiches]